MVSSRRGMRPSGRSCHLWYPTRVTEEPRITAEHVRRAEQEVKRLYAQPYIERALTRMRAYYMASCLWAIFLGTVLGRYVMHGFAWGSLGIAIIYTVIAIVIYRRNRD